jgi:hypothetical protein
MIGVLNHWNDQPLCIFCCDGIEQHVVENAKDDGRCGNAESQGKYRDECESQILA